MVISLLANQDLTPMLSGISNAFSLAYCHEIDLLLASAHMHRMIESKR